MVTATANRPPDLSSIVLPDIVQRVSKAMVEAAKIIPDMIQDNMIDEGTRGKSGRNRWARLTHRTITYRKSYPHRGSQEQKARYFANHIPLRDTNTLFNSFRPGPVQKTRDGLSIRVTSTTDYGWRHEYGIGRTPDGQPIWRRSHMYIWKERDVPRIRKVFTEHLGAAA